MQLRAWSRFRRPHPNEIILPQRGQAAGGRAQRRAAALGRGHRLERVEYEGRVRTSTGASAPRSRSSCCVRSGPMRSWTSSRIPGAGSSPSRSSVPSPSGSAADARTAYSAARPHGRRLVLAGGPGTDGAFKGRHRATWARRGALSRGGMTPRCAMPRSAAAGLAGGLGLW